MKSRDAKGPVQPFDPDKAMPRSDPEFWRDATLAEHLWGIKAACRYADCWSSYVCSQLPYRSQAL